MPTLVSAEAQGPSGTRINLNAAVETQVPNDEVVISFRVEKEGIDARTIRQYVNKVAAAIKNRLAHEKGVKLKTTGRNIQPIWKHVKNQPRQRTGWRMTQTGEIVSQHLDAVPGWLDAIEAEGANLSGLQFRISADTTKAVQDTLRLQAIASFRDKAAVIAKGLSAKTFRIIRLNTSSHAPQPVRYRAEMAMMSKSMAADAPSLSSGEGKVSVNVTGEIETPFIDFPTP
ncbi:SIMPL domain-containing protein [Mariprofundus sp. EBB-1]|uniref:SIMPL domain-containing protein n=1 Tax=Mariprofundus sp. EBB-1 TaxID=2650971 RepID=UPI001F36075B|nr:SIMPL domain-containing protein [Mariprofundus sp. EBB-1]